MPDFNMDLKNCDEAYIADQLRRQLAVYDKNPLRTWRWWSGFLWGAIMIAAMDFGDVWLCVGACNNADDQREGGRDDLA